MSDWFRRNRHLYPDNWDEIATRIKSLAAWRCEACDVPHGAPPHVLTVHHLDSTPANVGDENLVALCQVCHLRAQGIRPQLTVRADLLARLRLRHEIEMGQLCLPLSVREVHT